MAKNNANLLIGGTNANGLGGALLYSGTGGSDWREHSDTQIDDLMLKGKLQLDEANSLMPWPSTTRARPRCRAAERAAFDDDPYQSTRLKDKFWGRRTMFNFGYDYKQDDRQFSVNSFFTKTLRSGYLDQGSFVSLSPRRLGARYRDALLPGRRWVTAGTNWASATATSTKPATNCAIAADQQQPAHHRQPQRPRHPWRHRGQCDLPRRPHRHRPLDHHPGRALRDDRLRAEQQPQRPALPGHYNTACRH
jgi:outer membrane receptor for Fe3+-dicitrate